MKIGMTVGEIVKALMEFPANAPVTVDNERGLNILDVRTSDVTERAIDTMIIWHDFPVNHRNWHDLESPAKVEQ